MQVWKREQEQVQRLQLHAPLFPADISQRSSRAKKQTRLSSSREGT